MKDPQSPVAMPKPKRFPFLKLPLWSSTSATWEEMQPVRRALTLGVLLMVVTGPEAFAVTETLDGVTEERIYVSLVVYISSLITVAGAFYILGRWTKGREAAQDELAHNYADLLQKVANLEARTQRYTP